MNDIAKPTAAGTRQVRSTKPNPRFGCGIGGGDVGEGLVGKLAFIVESGGRFEDRLSQGGATAAGVFGVGNELSGGHGGCGAD